MPALPHHDSSGRCPRCQFIFNRYPAFHAFLRSWFESFQEQHPEAHISCAGRNEIDQDALFYSHPPVTKASWPHSAHNWNAAIDVFCMIPGNPDIYDKTWFYSVLGPAIPASYSWYGRANAPFPEMPHIEVSGWETLAKSGFLRMVDADDTPPTEAANPIADPASS